MLNRRRLLIAQNENYTPLNWIQTTGTQYIDTGIECSNRMKVELDYELTTLSGGFIIFGARYRLNVRAYTWQKQSSGNYGSGYSGNFKGDISVAPDTNRHTVIKYAGLTYLDGNMVASQKASAFTTYSLYLGACNTSNAPVAPSPIKIYSCKVYIDGVLTLDLVPALVGGTPCLYDKISDTPYYNDGTGDFLYG